MNFHKPIKDITATTKENINIKVKAIVLLVWSKTSSTNNQNYSITVKKEGNNYEGEFSNGLKNGYVLWPVRTAVSGKQMTPAGATEIMELLGKEESINRIKKGIEKLQASI